MIINEGREDFELRQDLSGSKKRIFCAPNELESLGKVLKGTWRLEGKVDVPSAARLKDREGASVGFGINPHEGAGTADRQQLQKATVLLSFKCWMY